MVLLKVKLMLTLRATQMQRLQVLQTIEIVTLHQLQLLRNN
jgi:hypothetical protein